jgi:hypothetical protein
MGVAMSEQKVSGAGQVFSGLVLVGVLVWWFGGDALSKFFRPVSRADVTVDYSVLMSEIRANPAAATQKYGNKTIRVTGPVHQITMVGSRPVVSVGVLLKNIDCQADSSQADAVARLKKGGQVAVQGRLELGGIFPALRPCVIQ